jgi:RQC domain
MKRPRLHRPEFSVPVDFQNTIRVIPMSKSIENDNKSLSQTDILTILSAADSIIGLSGRTMLAKILKGSRDKKLLGLKLDACSSYGTFRDETIEAITEKIDWMIQHDFLAIEMSGKYPVIVFTDRG